MSTVEKNIIPRTFKPLSRGAYEYLKSHDIDIFRLGHNQKRWVNALMSGKYNKGTKHLCTLDKKGNEYHCCLGVVCEISNINKKNQSISPKDYFDSERGVNGNSNIKIHRVKDFYKNDSILPEKIMNQFKFYSEQGHFRDEWLNDSIEIYNMHEEGELKPSKYMKEILRYIKVFEDIQELGIGDLTEMNDGVEYDEDFYVSYTHKQIASFINAYPQSIFKKPV